MSYFSKFNIAPLTYFALQSLIMGSCIYSNSYFLSYKQASNIVLWIDILLAFLFYLITFFRDVNISIFYIDLIQPGYVHSSDLPQTDNPLSFQNRNTNKQPFAPVLDQLQQRTRSIEQENVHIDQEDSSFREIDLECEASVQIENDDDHPQQNPNHQEDQQNMSFQLGKLQSPDNKPNYKQQTPQFGESEKSTKDTQKDTQKDEDSDVYFYEKRYCTKCNQEQLLRSKHCSKCNRCVASYDHHCPWMGNCIGEKNKCPFIWFLITQEIQIIMTIIQLSINYETLVLRSWMILIGLLIVFFLIFVSSLLIFHSYLVLNNLTTWEKLSWHKINYLKGLLFFFMISLDLPPQIQFPFSQGFKVNLKQFCKVKVMKLRIWEFNQEALKAVVQE